MGQLRPILLVVTQMNSVAVFINYYSYIGISTAIIINANVDAAAKAVRCVWFYLHSNSEMILQRVFVDLTKEASLEDQLGEVAIFCF